MILDLLGRPAELRDAWIALETTVDLFEAETAIDIAPLART